MSLILSLEVISICNAQCSFCPYRKSERARGRMSMDLYRKIIDEAATIPEIIWINICGLGEPCLDRDLVDRVAYAHKARPDWLIKMYTNGVYLTPERFDALMDAGLGTVDISLNAVTPEQHKRVMGLAGRFDTVCEHAEHAIKAGRDRVSVQVKAVVNGDEFTQADQLRFIQRWGLKAAGGYGMTVLEGNWAGTNRTLREVGLKKMCPIALTQIVVQWNGTVNLCCFDPLGKYSFGDLSKQTIREVYNSADYVWFREMHEQNRADEHPLCRVCTRG